MSKHGHASSTIEEARTVVNQMVTECDLELSIVKKTFVFFVFFLYTVMIHNLNNKKTEFYTNNPFKLNL